MTELYIPNFMNTLAQAQGAAAQTNQMRQQNALAGFYRDNGAALMAGDAEALNGLARLDPQAAFGMQRQEQEDAWRMDERSYQRDRDQRQDARQAQADARRATLDGRDDQEWKFKLDAHMKGLKAEELAEQTKRLEGTLRGAAWFYQMGDRAGYEGFLKSEGMDPLEYSFDQFPAHAARYAPVLDAMKAFKPDIPSGAQTLDYRAREAGLVPGTPEYTQFMLTGGKNDGLAIDVDPATGAVSVRQGQGAGSAKPLTEAQSKDAAYATRAEGALATLDPIANELTDRASIVADKTPLGIGRGMQTDQYQVARNAGDEFLQAILRKDTGAAITAQEQDLYGKTYLPQPGDGEAILKQKAQARRRALEAMKAGMSAAAILQQEKALDASGSDRVNTPARRLRFNPETGDFE